MSEAEELRVEKNIRSIIMPVYSHLIATVLNDAEAESTTEESENFLYFMAPSAKILIVDDVRTNLMVAKGLMAPYKMLVDTCMSGADAINMVKETQYDLIFMDYMMPGMDGIEATVAIRSLPGEDDYYRTVPIIALTANLISEVKEKYIECGMNDLLEKPIIVPKLNGILRKWIPWEKREPYIEGKASDEQKTTVPVKGLDIKHGLMLSGNNMNNYMNVLRVFHKDTREKIEQIKSCLRDGDIRMFTILVHGLKSATMNVGAAELSKLAEALETAGNENDASRFIAKNIDNFLVRLEELLNDISGALYNDTVTEIDTEQLEFLKETLTQLKSALDDMDIQNINIFIKSLQEKKWDKINNERLCYST